METSLLCGDELGYLRYASSTNAYASVLHRFGSESNKKDLSVLKLCSSFNRQMECNLYALARKKGSIEIVRAGGGGFFSNVFEYHQKTKAPSSSSNPCVGLDFAEDGTQITATDDEGTVTVLRVKQDSNGTWKQMALVLPSFS